MTTVHLLMDTPTKKMNFVARRHMMTMLRRFKKRLQDARTIPIAQQLKIDSVVDLHQLDFVESLKERDQDLDLIYYEKRIRYVRNENKKDSNDVFLIKHLP